MQDFMGKDGFSWFVGVVEDRNDPAKIGRVRVRVLGRHNEDLTQVKTADLPWAHVMHPVTDPSMQGLGHTPSFLTQGSWVVGFFRDTEAQQPVIMGTLPGVAASQADNSKGFNDPRGLDTDIGIQKAYASEHGPTYGPYPGPRKSGHGSSFASHDAVGESDTNRLALGKISETHNSLINRRAQRLHGDPVEANDEDSSGTGIPTATKPYIKSLSVEAEQETRGLGKNLIQKEIVEDANPYISATYPYNHVFESESGHITEVDDSPGAERMFRQHMAGTFEEIHPDGSVVTKIIGDKYEIVIGSENIVIKGSQNITVEGSVRELIKGDYIQEIEGNFYQKIHKNHRVKVGVGQDAAGKPLGGNREEEIVGNYGYNINKDVHGRVGGDAVIIHEKSKSQIVGGMYQLSVSGKEMDSNLTAAGIFITTGSNYMLGVTKDLSISTISGIVSMKSGSTLNIKSDSAMTINPETSLSQIVGTSWSSTTGTTWAHTSTGNLEINGARIDLN